MSDNKDDKIKNKMTDDKYILMGLDDERAKDMAEVLGNKTCKKIIDFLAETKEASEQDISTALGIPLNTTEYNLNKLKKAGLVVASKNFFWSRKGRKIEMYQLAKKHIIISPTKKPNMTAVKALLPVIIAFAFIAAIIAIVALVPPEGSKIDVTSLNKFSSAEELNKFLKENTKTDGFFRDAMEAVGGVAKGAANVQVAPMAATAESDSSGGGASDYSSTNIQVEGVDEADIVKNDGKYIYVVSGGKVKIVDAYPAENMKILSEINLSGVREIYINQDNLVVFASGGYSAVSYAESVKCLGCDGGYDSYRESVYVYDISDKKNPELKDTISMDGNYVNSRMIGDYVYVISNKYVNIQNPEPPVFGINGVETKIAAEDVYYWNYPDSSYVFTSITAINVNNGEVNNEVYLTGSSNTIYVSQNNIYLTYTKTFDYKEYANSFASEVAYPILPGEYDDKVKEIMDSEKNDNYKISEMRKIIENYSDSLTGDEKSEFAKEFSDSLVKFEENIAKKMEKTVIHRINIDKDKIEYTGVGEVPGNVLNQFSMDEYNGYFRIATTVGNFWEGKSVNNLYVLDDELKITGSVEDLAKGEKIYSARFIGKRAYLVTFKKVDPLFVIDLSNPKNPEVLGYLKITGFSDYLHPYDENHVIGIGKEAVAASDEEINSRNLQFAWYQGIKISVFDVSDVSNPVETAKIEIGDRGTDSSALYDHKAVLFDKERNLLVIPVTLAEINKSRYRTCSEEELKSSSSYSYCLTPHTYGEQVWQGAYVLNIDVDEISIRGKITHAEDYKPKYGPAEEEPISATRIIDGNNWTKVKANSWKSAYEWGYSEWGVTDDDLDRMKGGVNYKDYIYDYSSQIQRSLYMDDVLYTISQAKIKANNLGTVEEISQVDLGYKDNYNYPLYK